MNRVIRRNLLRTTFATLFTHRLIFLIAALLVSHHAHSSPLSDDAMLKKLVEWQLGFTTNQQQYDTDTAAQAKPAWALSELRILRIWHDREDGYWLYYEVSQPAVRPDRNEIWRAYRNEFGDLKIDIHWFKDTEAGLKYWGKWKTPEAFDDIKMSEFRTQAGCNLTYHWIPDTEKFSGINSHKDCPVGTGYILQHIEISKTDEDILQRNDWHTFYDAQGVPKSGAEFKTGTAGAYIHYYQETYPLNIVP